MDADVLVASISDAYQAEPYNWSTVSERALNEWSSEPQVAVMIAYLQGLSDSERNELLTSPSQLDTLRGWLVDGSFDPTPVNAGRDAESVDGSTSATGSLSGSDYDSTGAGTEWASGDAEGDTQDWPPVEAPQTANAEAPSSQDWQNWGAGEEDPVAPYINLDYANDSSSYPPQPAGPIAAGEAGALEPTPNPPVDQPDQGQLLAVDQVRIESSAAAHDKESAGSLTVEEAFSRLTDEELKQLEDEEIITIVEMTD